MEFMPQWTGYCRYYLQLRNHPSWFLSISVPPRVQIPLLGLTLSPSFPQQSARGSGQVSLWRLQVERRKKYQQYHPSRETSQEGEQTPACMMHHCLWLHFDSGNSSLKACLSSPTQAFAGAVFLCLGHSFSTLPGYLCPANSYLSSRC